MNNQLKEKITQLAEAKEAARLRSVEDQGVIANRESQLAETQAQLERLKQEAYNLYTVHKRDATNGRIQSRVGERNARIREVAPSDRATKERSGERCGQDELRRCNVRPAGRFRRRHRRKRRKIRRLLVLRRSSNRHDHRRVIWHEELSEKHPETRRSLKYNCYRFGR